MHAFGGDTEIINRRSSRPGGRKDAEIGPEQGLPFELEAMTHLLGVGDRVTGAFKQLTTGGVADMDDGQPLRHLELGDDVRSEEADQEIDPVGFQLLTENGCITSLERGVSRHPAEAPLQEPTGSSAAGSSGHFGAEVLKLHPGGQRLEYVTCAASRP